ncbi:uncharacterized protein LOC100890964 [Strongylocentrotus purpuratus]|uniref:Uncharacterized protein n=1 Tax=Strongylocentrotus purpuratus TaxID=7668 RepID=A0A7M7GI00_STRPU|nr:uncharacterized protein LOC100890964 [Strongylocentrotus purpuratus]
MDFKLKGKTAAIIGVEGRLGKEVAVHFASLGCSLALVGKNQSKLDDIARDCISKGLISKQVLAVRCDLNQESDFENIFSRISGQLGPLHVLVNCEGAISYGRLSELTPSAIDDAMQVNTLTTAMATKAATSYLEHTRGVVINISCSCAHRTSPSLLAFGMAMSSINYFTQCTAIELAPKGIRVNAVSPSVDVFESLLDPPSAKPYQEPRKAPLNQSPPTVDDVLKTITFLASDESSFITGEIICVDNGLHIAGLPF